MPRERRREVRRCFMDKVLLEKRLDVQERRALAVVFGKWRKSVVPTHFANSIRVAGRDFAALIGGVMKFGSRGTAEHGKYSIY